MENNIIVSGYESIKAGLLENGFVSKNNIFAREINRQKIIEVNGQQFTKDIKKVIITKDTVINKTKPEIIVKEEK